MFNLFGEEVPEKKRDKKRTAWNRRFQAWSDRMTQEEGTPYGKCAHGAICDFCADNSYGSPCVRALNEWMKETGRKVDYDKEDFEAVFMGEEQDGL